MMRGVAAVALLFLVLSDVASGQGLAPRERSYSALTNVAIVGTLGVTGVAFGANVHAGPKPVWFASALGASVGTIVFGATVNLWADPENRTGSAYSLYGVSVRGMGIGLLAAAVNTTGLMVTATLKYDPHLRFAPLAADRPGLTLIVRTR